MFFYDNSGTALFNIAKRYFKHTFQLRHITAPLGSFLILLMLIGCGGQTIILKPPTEISKAIFPKKAAIFPLADYSKRKPFIRPYPLPNLLIIEEITQNLVGHGYNISIQEDVNDVLISEEILLPVPIEVHLPDEILKRLANYNKDAYGRWHGITYNPPQFGGVIEEIDEKEILDRLNKELQSKLPSLQIQGVQGLNKEVVKNLAQKLDVDIIFRGRILEYGFKDKNTLNPIEGGGLLTFLFDEPRNVFFGVTNKDKYDTVGLIRNALESMVIGGAIGGGIGAAAGSGELGAAIGSGLGLLRANKRPPVETSVMHIRLYAQDGKTGKVLWTNVIEVERVPESRFAFDEKHPKVLLDKLTREGVKLLVDDFIKNTKL